MKKLLLIINLMLIPLGVFSQQSEHKNPLPLAKYNDNVNMPLTAKERNQIIEAYGDSAESLVFNNPHLLKSIKHILRNRVEIKLITDQKNTKPCPKLSEVPYLDGLSSAVKTDGPFNRDNFNPLIYGFDFYSRAASIYQVDNTNYYIIIKSQYQ